MPLPDRWFELPFFQEGRHDDIVEELFENSNSLDWTYCPTQGDIYQALYIDPYETKVVILGQDPYPTPGYAHGLAFSVSEKTRTIPKSLKNIFRELVEDVGCPYPRNGSLLGWHDQGVMLLNTALTCAPNQPGSHLKLGWSEVAKQVLETLSNNTTRRVFILWGRHAQAYKPYINTTNNHLIIESPHPSPLSAHMGFFGSKPFTRANAHLEEPINWAQTNRRP